MSPEATDLARALSYFERTRQRLAEPPPVYRRRHGVLNLHARVFGLLCAQLQQAPAPAPSVDCRIVDRIILEKLTDGSDRKAKSPDFVVPTGRLAPRAALDRIGRNYEELAHFVQVMDGPSP